MKLNKLVFLFLMLFCSHLGAQDSLTKTKKDKVTFSEKDIRVDSDSIELNVELIFDRGLIEHRVGQIEDALYC